MIDHELLLFTGNANPTLAKQIARYLKTKISEAKVGRFPEGEVSVEIGRDVRGADVFLIQGTSPPSNDNSFQALPCICVSSRCASRSARA